MLARHQWRIVNRGYRQNGSGPSNAAKLILMLSCTSSPGCFLQKIAKDAKGRSFLRSFSSTPDLYFVFFACFCKKLSCTSSPGCFLQKIAKEAKGRSFLRSFSSTSDLYLAFFAFFCKMLSVLLHRSFLQKIAKDAKRRSFLRLQIFTLRSSRPSVRIRLLALPDHYFLQNHASQISTSE